MPKPAPIDYADASGAVKAVYDEIKQARNVADVNNFWKYIAHDERTLRRTWDSLREVMAPGALDPLVKELVYLAVSVTNNCDYCIASHSAAARLKWASGEAGLIWTARRKCVMARSCLCRDPYAAPRFMWMSKSSGWMRSASV